VTTTPVSKILQEAGYARDLAERSMRYAESSGRIYHNLYDRQREALDDLLKRVQALEATTHRHRDAGP
jgi:hypothetical protein